MQPIDESLRKCMQCLQAKECRAFVNYREICRSCWLSLTENEKKLHLQYIAPIAKKKAEDKYWSNKPPRPSYTKRKLLKLGLNIKVL